MRFVMFMIPNVSDDSWGPTPDMAEMVAAMTRYNQELERAGVLLTLDGLHSPAEAARVSFSGGAATVTDGPFAEAKEVVGGYWMIQVGSRAEAVEWARRCPAADGDVIEIREIQELEDFSPEIQQIVGRAGE
jgi:hypothetical protein